MENPFVSPLPPAAPSTSRARAPWPTGCPTQVTWWRSSEEAFMPLPSRQSPQPPKTIRSIFPASPAVAACGPPWPASSLIPLLPPPTPVIEVEPAAPASTIVGSVSTSAVLTINAPFPVTYEAVQASQKALLWLRYSETTVPVVNTSYVANSGSTGVAGIGTARRYPAFPEPGALVRDGDTLRKSTVNATHTTHLLNQAHSFGGNQKTPAMSSCPRPCRCVMTLPRPAAA